MNCAIELNQQRERLERFVHESAASGLTLLKNSFPRKPSAPKRCEIEILKEQIREMESSCCHPEALSWLQQTVNTLESNRVQASLRLVK